jgi:hypothetical protein
MSFRVSSLRRSSAASRAASFALPIILRALPLSWSAAPSACVCSSPVHSPVWRFTRPAISSLTETTWSIRRRGRTQRDWSRRLCCLQRVVNELIVAFLGSLPLDGSSSLSLSRTSIRRSPLGGCRLPDAILHGKRSFRPRSRAVQRLSVAEFQVRLLSLLQLVVAPPIHKPGQDTPAIFFRVLTAGSGSATAFDGAFARHHGSRLFTHRLLFLTVQRCRF